MKILRRFERFYRGFLISELCLESFLWLFLYKTAVRFLPYSFSSRSFGRFQFESLKQDVCPQQKRFLRKLRFCVERTARRVPWQSRCLDQALAARMMLAIRRMRNTIYFGVIKNENRWLAHAWVRCGNRWVIGKRPEDNYTVVGAYT